MEALKRLHEIEPTAWIAAGAIRSSVWDVMVGRAPNLAQSDVDVILHNPEDLSRSFEQRIERQLKASMPTLAWEVVNQARVHMWETHLCQGMKPLVSVEDAVGRFPETATCVAARLSEAGSLVVMAPHGLYDLLNFILRPTPNVPLEIFQERLQSKAWTSRWPKLRVMGTH